MIIVIGCAGGRWRPKMLCVIPGEHARDSAVRLFVGKGLEDRGAVHVRQVPRVNVKYRSTSTPLCLRSPHCAQRCASRL